MITKEQLAEAERALDDPVDFDNLRERQCTQGPVQPEPPAHWRFRLGDRVRKVKGAQWNGRIVGFYTTSLTHEGYAVESERERGSVQIYPVSALEKVS